MPLNTDYRPKSFDEMLGNKSTIASLKAIYNRESDWPHAVLLQGPKGCGKTTIAKIIVGLLGCRDNDFVQIDGGDVKAETVRDLKEQSLYRPLVSKNRVWLIDEAHMIGQGGGTEKNIPQNNMLTLLEESPEHAYFILCTTDPRRLVETIRSRCHTFEVQYLTGREMMVLLQNVLKEEKTDVSMEVLRKIADVSDGCPRDALKILDQVIDMEPGEMEEGVISFAYSDKQVLDLYNGLMKKDSWKRLSSVLAKIDLSNPETPRRAIIGLASAIMMRGEENVRAALVYEAFKEPFYDNGKAGFVFSVYHALVDLCGLDDDVPF
jgi:DNA polymerase-3 subunit gamma/tau